MDDVFSSIDSETEKTIFHSISSNIVGKTILFATHRTSILTQMDHVVYLQDGLVVEQGTPLELLKTNGPFAALVELQRKNEE